MLKRSVHAAVGWLLAAGAPVLAQVYDTALLVPPSPLHSVEGIALDEAGWLYGTSIHSRRVYKIDTRNGHVDVLVDSPRGESDDVAIGPSGTAAAGVIAWTAQRSGEVRALYPDGRLAVLQSNVPRVNPIAFDASGRLFAAQLAAGDDTLWELDPLGRRPPQRVLTGTRLNGFAFGRDGRLYAPNFGTDKLVAIDVDRRTVTTVASGLGAPAAVRVGHDGMLYSVDYVRGDLWRIDPGTGQSQRLAQVAEALDSLAIAPDGRVFMSAAADSRVWVFDPASAELRILVPGWFTLPTGVVLTTWAGRPQLLVGDTLGYRYVDRTQGDVTRPPWAMNRNATTALDANEEQLLAAYGPARRLRLIDRRSDAIVAETTELQAPRGVLLEDTGSVLAVDASTGRLVRWRDDRLETVADGLQRPVALLRLDRRRVLVSEFDSGRLVEIRLDTGARRVRVTGLERPTGLALLPDGRIAIVESAARRVRVADLRSGRYRMISEGLPIALGGLDLPEDMPAGIAADRDGVIYLACPGDNSIRMLRLR